MLLGIVMESLIRGMNGIEERMNLKKWDEDENEIRKFLEKLRNELEVSFIQSRLDRGVKEDEI